MYFKLAHKRAKSVTKFQSRLINYLCKKKLFNGALLCIDYMLKTLPNDFYLNNEKGYVLGNTGLYEQALDFFDIAHALEPLSPTPLNNKSWIYNGVGKHIEALECCDKALEIGQENHYILINKGNALLKLDRLEEALACFDKALTINNQIIEAYYGKAMVLYRYKDYQGCLDNLSIYGSKEVKDVDVYKYMASCYSNLEKYDEQVCMYDRIIKINKKLPWVYNFRGNALCYLGRFEEALGNFERAIDIQPGYADAYYNKSRLLAHFRCCEAAIDYLKKAAALDREYKDMALEDELLNNIKVYKEFKDIIFGENCEEYN